MKVAVALVVVLALGFAGGFVAGRWTAPATPPDTIEQTALFDDPPSWAASRFFTRTRLRGRRS
jgi:hypothetical protein